MRVFLVIAAWMLGVVAVVALVGFILWSRYGDEYVEVFKTATRDGMSLGKTKGDAACYEAILDKMRNCAGTKCAIEAKVFASSCFRSVAIRTDMCKGVPPVFDFVNYASWLNDKCEEVAPKNEGCGKVLEEVAKYCSAQHG